MTVGTQVPRVEYVEDGSTALFSTPYAFFDQGDLVVTRFTGAGTHESDAHVLLLGHDYSVSGGDTGDGPAVGGITRLTAAVVGATLRIDRHTKHSQELHYEPGDDFPARSHEDGLDRLEMQIQELIRDQLNLHDLIKELAEHVLKAGPGIRIDYDEDANTITITATGVEETIANLPDCLMLSGDQQTFTGTEGEGNTGGLTTEEVQDIIAAMLVDGTGISHSYNDATGKITLTNTAPESGGGGGGGTLGPLLADIDATGIAANEILVGDAPNSITRKPISAFMQALLAGADAPTVLAALGGIRIVGQSLGSPGFMKLSNGVIIQWGSHSFPTGSTAVTYPTPFSTFSIPVMSACGDQSLGAQDNPAMVTSASPTGFSAYCANDNTSTGWWIAIGI